VLEREERDGKGGEEKEADERNPKIFPSHTSLPSETPYEGDPEIFPNHKSLL
jgi:hypothetical protein